MVVKAGRDVDTAELQFINGGVSATFFCTQQAIHAAHAINNHDRMVEEIAELKGVSDKLSEAIQLLTKIAHPIAAMEDEAESCGYDINASQCISLSNDAEYLKNIAKQGLEKLNQGGEG